MANDPSGLSTDGPRWLTPELLAVASFVAPAACLGSALVSAQPMPGRVAATAIVATAVVAALLARLALRRRDGRAHDVRCLTGAAAAGIGLWGLVFALGDKSALG